MAWPDLTTELTTRAKAITRPGAGASNPDWLSKSVSDALDRAKVEIVGIVAGRGYSGAQVDTWASGPGKSLVLSLALYFVACDSRLDINNVTEERDSQPPAVLDCRPYLATMLIVDANGDEVTPANVAVTGGVTGGRVKPYGETFRTRDGRYIQW